MGYVNRLYRRPGTVGFKLMYTQLRDHPEILVYLALRRVRVVHLVRRNHLDVIVSDELARLTGTSHAAVGETTELPKVCLNTATLVDRIEILEDKLGAVRRLVRLSTCPSIEVSYEALLGGEQELNRILDFLDVPPSAIQSNSILVKRGTRTHRDTIANYDEVKEVLAATAFLRLLQ